MVVINPEVFDKDKIYWCNGLVSEWLIYTKHLSVFCIKNKKYGFVKTPELEEALKDLPFWLKIMMVI